MPARASTLAFFVSEDAFFCSHFLERAVAARALGYRVLVLTRVGDQGDRLASLGLEVIPLDVRRRSLNPLAALATLVEVVRVYRRERPTLVHHVALKPILLGTLAARLAGVPHVVNAVVGMGFAFSSEKLLARLLRPLVSIALRLLVNPAGSRVVFENTDDLRAFVDREWVRSDAAVLIRGAGVDVEALRPARPPSVPLVVLVARMLWDKGVGEFVDAARHLKGTGARFALVGDTDPGNHAAIADADLAAWRSEGVVECWGFRADIGAVLAQASIACLPSYREGLPKSLLEAMACGLPCVTTDVPGCREAVRDGDNGLLVPPRDSRALAQALARLLDNPALRRQMGDRGRERAVAEFSSDIVVQQTLALYRQMLSTDGAWPATGR